MKFTCDRTALQKGISIVEKAISQRTSLAIMENIHLELKEGSLRLRASDLEISIEYAIPISNFENEGIVCVKAKTISSIISKLQSKTIEIEVNDQYKMDIRSDKVSFDILCTNPEEYPMFPEIEKGNLITLELDQLKQLIKHTIFSVSFDETRQFLNGILVKNETDHLYFVSTDGYRLSMKRLKVDQSQNDFSVIIPHKAMNELQKIMQQMPSDKEMKMNISENQVSFTMDHFILVSRVIKGQFPDYKRVLPKESDFAYSIPRRPFIEASERSSIIASESNNVIHLTLNDKTLLLHANAPTLGEFNEEVSILKINGQEEVKIAFNVRLVLDALKTLEEDDVKIEFNTGLSPFIIKPVSNDDCTFIIMPIRTNENTQAPEQAEKEPAKVEA